MSIVVTNGKLPNNSCNAVFQSFDWKERKEEDAEAMKELYAHLHTQFQRFGVEWDKFSLVDVHSRTTILNFSDERIGTLRGGTDLIIVPAGVADISYVQEVCVVLEVQTSKRSEDDKLPKNTPQLIVELLSASCLTNQPTVLAILSDVNNLISAMILTYDKNKKQHGITQYSGINLNDMGNLVQRFLLSDNVVPEPNFIACENENTPESHNSVLERKRKWVTNVQTTLAWEHFAELVGDTLPFSTEWHKTCFVVSVWKTLLCFKPEYADMYC